jgi:hypothetical protein
MNPMNNESPDSPKRNWPLICGGAAVSMLVAGLVAGLIALYIANFNVLEWLE